MLFSKARTVPEAVERREAPRLDKVFRVYLEGEKFVLLVTPFVDGGGLALSNGAPLRQDPRGNPLVGLIPISGRLRVRATGLRGSKRPSRFPEARSPKPLP